MTTCGIILNWQRQDTLPQVLHPWLTQPFVDEVLIVDNAGTLTPNLPVAEQLRTIDHGKKIVLVEPGRNLQPSGRWWAAMFHTKADTILLQDDDYVVKNWPKLMEFAKANPEAIVHALDDGHRAHDQKEYRLVGWGAVFKREWIKPAWMEYVAKFGEDDILTSKADRIVTALMRRKAVVIPADVDVLPSARGKMAMYRQPDHAKLVKTAMDRVLELLNGQKA